MTSTDPFADIIGQDLAIRQLRAAVSNPVHAYLFVGPRGSGKRRAAVRMAGELVGAPADRERNRALAIREEHPDVAVFEPAGNAFLMEEAEAVIIEASRSPAEAGRKVLILDRFHDADGRVAANLLKTIEEPPASTMFILLAEHVPPEHITIASRSVTIDFPAVSEAVISAALQERGIGEERAQATARGACGDVNRAELLLTDTAFVERRDLWWDVPSRFDGTGYAISEIVKELTAVIDAAQLPLDEKHAGEAASMDETEELTGTRGSGRKAMETRQKREARLHRTDEWQMGLSTLAHRYRENLVTASNTQNPEVFFALRDASSALQRNPSEELWITNVLMTLSSLTTSS